MKLIKRLIGKTGFASRRQSRYGKDWTWLDPSQLEGELDIIDLVSPLRYDIVIRQDFISLYLANQSLYHSGFNRFLELAIQHPYYNCFQKMRPQLIRNDAAHKTKFADRIKRFINVYIGIAESGFDKTQPIEPKTGMEILPTQEGKKVSGKFFMGDGCHRLASLMALGYQTLPLDYIRVKSFPKLSPVDGTLQLVHDVPIESKEYFKFLSSRYASPYSFESKSELVEYIKREKPELQDEVLSIIHIDGMNVKRPELVSAKSGKVY